MQMNFLPWIPALLLVVRAAMGGATDAPPATVTLPVLAQAGISSFRPSHPGKPDPRDASWCGQEPLVLRQNQNWAGFEARVVLLRFDVAPIRGWTVESATLHLALAHGDLYGIGVGTVLNAWQEGRCEGEPEPGAPCWRYRAAPATGQAATAENRWCWPESDFAAAAWLHPAVRYSHAGPDRITRHTDSDGIVWLAVPVDPAVIHAMAVGASHGIVLCDDKGQVAEARMLERNPKPYVYDAAFDAAIHTRHTLGGKYAPRLEVTGRQSDFLPPNAPRGDGQTVLADGDGTATIHIVAPGDDGAVGLAQAYCARRAATFIDASSWDAAAAIPLYDLPLPQCAGTPQDIRLTGLPAGDWHVALRAMDEAGNMGAPLDIAVRVPASTACRIPEQAGDARPPVEWQFDDCLGVTIADEWWKDDPVAGRPWPAPGTEEPSATVPRDGRAVPANIALTAARNEVVSCQLIFRRLHNALRNVKVSVGDLHGSGSSVITAARQVELFREWYFPDEHGRWAADACLPLTAPFTAGFDLPAVDNVGTNQQSQAVWLDLHVPRDTAAGDYRGAVTIVSPSLVKPVILAITVRVRAFALPDTISIPVELNTYSGVGAYAGVDIAHDPARFLAVERAYYALAHRHRCTLNVLRYTHSGRTTEQAVPPLAGTGAACRVADWSAWDRRFGPYLDGSAFRAADGYAGPGQDTPLSHFYLPFHENWPLLFDPHYADRCDFPDRPTFAAWAGRSRRLEDAVAPDYATGWTNIVAEMMRHFATQGWTRTEFQFFFNNKYYYKCPFFAAPDLGMSGTPIGRSYWLLDEPVDFDDFAAVRYFMGLAHAGVRAASTPAVRVGYRADVSYPQMARGLWDGVVDLWCCSVFTELAATARERQARVAAERWGSYGGGSGVFDPHLDVLRHFLTRYAAGAEFLLPYWKNFGSGWRKSDDTSILYSGQDYAGTGRIYDGALPGIRLKLMRRAQQDIEYLELVARHNGWHRSQIAEALALWRDAASPPRNPTFATLSSARADNLRESLADILESKVRSKIE